MILLYAFALAGTLVLPAGARSKRQAIQVKGFAMSPIQELERALFGLGPLSRRSVHFVPRFVDDSRAYDPRIPAPAPGGAVRVNVWDAGPNVVLVAEVPGLTEKDVTLSFEHDVLTLSGERTPTVPEGYTAQRRERPTLRFSRAIRFNVPVDVAGITAVVKNGLLTVTLPKSARAAARAIPVQSVTH
ncbi:MAG: Hsp20/alpha crystallin family protein [Myxococcota bacterium]